MIHYSQLRTKALETFILDEVVGHRAAFEVGPFKGDGTVTVKFRSAMGCSANELGSYFMKALERFGYRYEQTDTHKVRLPLEQF